MKSCGECDMLRISKHISGSTIEGIERKLKQGCADGIAPISSALKPTLENGPERILKKGRPALSDITRSMAGIPPSLKLGGASIHAKHGEMRENTFYTVALGCGTQQGTLSMGNSSTSAHAWAGDAFIAGKS